MTAEKNIPRRLRYDLVQLGESFLLFADICFRSRDMSFQILGNLGEKCRKKIEHFVPFTKIVTSQVGLVSIQHLNQMWSESRKTWCTDETR